MTVTMRADPVELARALAGDLDAAFSDLVVAYQDGIYSGVRRLVPAAADAEDITQETFVRAYRALRDFSAPRIEQLALPGWLWTIALNLCRNAARRRSRKPAGAPLSATRERPDIADTAAAALATVAEDVWRKRLDALSLPIRTAVVLRHVVGLPYADIAAAVDRPVGTVKADVHRGLARLRDLLDNEAEEER